MREAIFSDNPKRDNRLDAWLTGRSEALTEFRFASEMARSGAPSLRTTDFNEIFNSYQQLRPLIVLTETEALRLERAGQLDQAWEWHKANLRCSRHCLMPPHMICHLIGFAIQSTCFRGIARWASCDTLTYEDLQQARDELAVDHDHSVSAFRIAKSNYLC